jgi:hypothetical protein
MTHKIKFILNLAFILIIGAVAIFLSVRYLALNSSRTDYLKKFVKIESLKVTNNDENLTAVVKIIVSNSGDRLVDNVPLAINYLDAQRNVISSDYTNLLQKGKYILAKTDKEFEITVTFPGDSKFIEPVIQY